MKRLLYLFWFGALAAAGALQAEMPEPTRFEKEIAAFENADKTNPPPQNAILFTGSSTIRLWTNLAKSFPTHKIINRGFGGSTYHDANYYFGRLVPVYKPKMVVIYSGSNDINLGESAAETALECARFVEKVEEALPGVPVAVVSITAAPSRWKDRDKVVQANKMISDFMGRRDNRIFINTYAAMLDADGQPRPELYKADRLHPNAKGYALWVPILAPYLDKFDRQ